MFFVFSITLGSFSFNDIKSPFKFIQCLTYSFTQMRKFVEPFG